MRDSNSSLTKGEKSKLEDSNHKSANGDVSTDISPDKASTGITASINNANSDDISPEGLLEVIS